MAQRHKAITIIQFKLEAQILKRRSEYGLRDRLLYDKIDFYQGTIQIDKRVHPLLDKRFQTVTPEEPRNIYYTLWDDEATVRRILEPFGLNPDAGYVVNEHVPVIVKKYERLLKAGGKLIVIDGGFARA